MIDTGAQYSAARPDVAGAWEVAKKPRNLQTAGGDPLPGGPPKRSRSKLKFSGHSRRKIHWVALEVSSMAV